MPQTVRGRGGNAVNNSVHMNSATSMKWNWRPDYQKDQNNRGKMPTKPSADGSVATAMLMHRRWERKTGQALGSFLWNIRESYRHAVLPGVFILEEWKHVQTKAYTWILTAILFTLPQLGNNPNDRPWVTGTLLSNKKGTQRACQRIVVSKGYMRYEPSYTAFWKRQM